MMLCPLRQWRYWIMQDEIKDIIMAAEDLIYLYPLYRDHPREEDLIAWENLQIAIFNFKEYDRRNEVGR